MPSIDIGGARIGYDLEGEGPGSKPWLALLHEIGGTRETWAVVARALAGRFKVLRYDQRGAGESSRIAGPFTMETQIDDLTALLDRLGAPERIHLAGVALGAALSVRFASRFPRRVESLVLACPAPNVDADRVKYLEERAAAVERDGMTVTADSSLANSYPPEVQRDRAVFAAYRERFLANDPKSYAAINRAFPAFDVKPELSCIRYPTLVLAGTHDKLRPPAFVREVASHIPGARYAEIDSGHIMPVQAPTAMVAAMTGFYDEIAIPPAAKSP
jgi:3-oxoadipate enol-lactonase